jgi:hypothetical protein
MRLTGLVSKRTFGSNKINEAKRYDIGSVWLSDGMAIFNRAEEEDDNFKRIAHIDRKGNLKTFESLPPDITKMFKIWADSIKKGINRPGSM